MKEGRKGERYKHYIRTVHVAISHHPDHKIPPPLLPPSFARGKACESIEGGRSIAKISCPKSVEEVWSSGKQAREREDVGRRVHSVGRQGCKRCSSNFQIQSLEGLVTVGSSPTQKAQWKCEGVVEKEIIETSSCSTDVVVVWRYSKKPGLLFFFLSLFILPRRNAALIPQTPLSGELPP
ncbi:hypothetical protein Naga_100252g13 [Nannochloropsis gaditana]|uniref:Uncharacterized protein n=1 Tax=Nannochloropsis gaditana TaxID=72520 RepID=W7T0S7_9STRA|nr:hypothetical protein Naga_100252g13 [Nannochloropsis gaditana]